MQDDTPEPSVTSHPRFRLSMGSVLYLFVCMSVALTVAVEAPPGETLFPGIPVYQPHVHWHYVLLSVATIGGIASLLDQWARIPVRPGLKVSRWLRVALSVLLALTLFSRLLVQRNALSLPDFDGLLFVDGSSLLDFTWLLLLIAAMQSLASPSALETVPHGWKQWVYAGLAVSLLIAISSQQAGIANLVHIATAGIEAAMSLQWQRQDAFPNHAAEGYFTYWTANAAVACLLLGVAASLFALNSKHRMTLRKFAALASASLLALCSGYSAWFWHVEMARVSPDGFTVGPAGNPTAFVIAAVPVALLCIWLAVIQCRQEGNISISIAREPSSLGRLPAWLLALGTLGASGMFLAEICFSSFGWSNLFGFTPLSERLISTLQYLASDPTSLVYMAVLLSALRLTNSLWRRRITYLSETTPSAVASAFLLYMLIAVVAAPTLAAYSFCSWLGPWYRW